MELELKYSHWKYTDEVGAESTMARTQVNVKLDDQMLREIESLVESKEYTSKTDVFVEALRLLLRTKRGKDLLKRIDEIREGTEQYPSVSKALIEDHEQEDAKRD